MTQAETNKANAQHSTGPKTPAGKERSSLNALRHGLTGQIVVMPNEDLAAYHRHLKSFTDEYHPKGATESNLVQSLADVSWRLNRVASIESTLLTLAADPEDILTLFERQSKVQSNLSLHSQRLSRQFERTVTQLRDLQKSRRADEHSEMEDLLNITDMFEDKGEPYDPSEDGFVFTQTQINTAIRTRNRENLALEAWEYECVQEAA